MPTVLTVVAALAGAFVLDRLNVPAGALIGAMVAVAAVGAITGEVTQLPDPVRFLAYAAVGWLLGQGLDREVLRELAGQALPIALGVVALLAFAWAMAWLYARTGLMDPQTAFLSFSPGGLSQMAILATDVRADVGAVASFHLVRVVAVLLLASSLSRVIAPPG